MKASELLEILLITSEKALSQEDERLNNHIANNRKQLEHYTQLTTEYFTYEQTLQLHKLIGCCMDICIANNFYNSECYRFTIIREIIIVLIHKKIIEDDLHMTCNDDFKKEVLKILPNCNYYLDKIN